MEDDTPIRFRGSTRMLSVAEKMVEELEIRAAREKAPQIAITPWCLKVLVVDNEPLVH
jgi:hypothetical protein